MDSVTIIHDGMNQLELIIHGSINQEKLIIHSSISQLKLTIHSIINQLKLIIHYRMIKWKIRSVKGPPKLEVALACDAYKLQYYPFNGAE